MKKQIVGTIFLLLAVLLSVAGIVIYWVNAHGEYYNDFTPSVMLYAGFGVVALLAWKVLSVTLGEKRWMDVLYLVAAILLAWAAVDFLGDRVESAAIILGSQLEAGNALAQQSLFTSFAGIGCFILGMILTGVSSFFQTTEADAQSVERE